MSESRRIAFCITDLDVGGAERALVRIVTGLNQRGWQSKVWCLSGPGELVQPLTREGIPVECLQLRSSQPVNAVQQLARGLREWQPRLLQTFLFHANLVGRMAAWRAGVPVVVSGLRVAERDAPWRMRLDRWSQRLVTMNVAVSQGVSNFSTDEVGLRRDKVCVIPNGVDVEAYQSATAVDWEQFGLPKDARVLLMVGRLHPQKAPDLFIASVAPVLAEQPDVQAVLVGEGPLRDSLAAQIQTLGLSGRVHLLGQRGDVASLLRESVACVLPSRWEGMPNVILEAMAAGCPVIATDVEGSRELVQTDITGQLVPLGNAGELTSRIRWVLKHPEEAARLANTAQVLIQTKFAWPSIVDQYVELYARLTNSREGVDIAAGN